MPFAFIPTALGVCFCLVWAFIGGMVFRDGQLTAQHECDSEVGILPMPAQRTVRRPSAAALRANRSDTEAQIRAAS